MPASSSSAIGNRPNLFREITVILVVKIALLVLLWFLFVRTYEVHADANSTAAAMGLHPDVGTRPAGRIDR